MASKFQGTGVALVTPFTSRGEIDISALESLVEHVVEGGVNYLVALGTTSESPTLNKAEKELALKTILKKNNSRVPVVLGKGGNDTLALIKDIKDTDFDGIDGLLSVAPWYNKPNEEGIYQHFSKVADSSPVPVLLYNVPGRTSSNISSRTTVRLAKEFSGHVVGIKEASGNMKQLMEIMAEKPESFSLISGDDALTLPMISIGGAGVISVIANAFPKDFSSMVNFATKGCYKEAREIHYRLLPVIDAMFAEGNPAGVKNFMKHNQLLDDYVRLPLVKVSNTLEEKIIRLNKEVSAS